MNTALIVGATGIAGSALAETLVSKGWEVLALSRHPKPARGVTLVAADLLDADGLAKALDGQKPTQVFITSWLRQETETENIRVNAAMVRNVLEAVRTTRTLRHVALVTGLKHTSAHSRRTVRASSPRPLSARTRVGSTSPTSTTRRRMSCSPPRNGTASPGRCTGRTR